MVTNAMYGTMTATMRSTMKALVQDRYGAPEVLSVRDLATPELKDGQVLVRVKAASVNALDWHMMRGEPFFLRLIGEGFRRPKTETRGADLAGVVDSIGRGVTRFKPGDEVFGSGIRTFAEYAAIREEGLVAKPSTVSFEQAGALGVAAFTALQGLRDKGGLQAGQRVLVHGAGGGVGTFAVQIAKALGAEVTAVCGPASVEVVRSIGADHVIDYTQTDFTRTGERYDVLLDVGGTKSLAACRRALTPNGRHVLVGGPTGRWFGPLIGIAERYVVNRFVGRKHVPFLAHRTQADLEFIRGLVEAGKVSPVIDRQYPLSEAAEAIRHVEAGHARGKVVVTI
jgi:NADPH:quinone reductase-like Zn-dependent oxidoreductase